MSCSFTFAVTHENHLRLLIYCAFDVVFPDLFAFADLNRIKTSCSAKDHLQDMNQSVLEPHLRLGNFRSHLFLNAIMSLCYPTHLPRSSPCLRDRIVYPGDNNESLQVSAEEDWSLAQPDGTDKHEEFKIQFCCLTASSELQAPLESRGSHIKDNIKGCVLLPLYSIRYKICSGLELPVAHTI